MLVNLTGCKPVILQLLQYLRETWSTKMAYEVVGVPSLHKDSIGIQAKERSGLLKKKTLTFI